MIPQSNPKANYLAHQTEIDAALATTLASGWYILGEQVKQFERAFADYLGLAHAAGVASGTDALHLAVRACGLGAGDAIVTVSNTAVATVAAIELAGATPVLVDVDPKTFTLDPQRLEDALKTPLPTGQRIRAVIPVHLYGHPAELPAIMAIARRYELLVIEDCAQAHGARWAGKQVATWGDIAAFSFYPTKNLGALGDGGAVATNRPELAERLKLLREYGWRERYISDIPGLNSRLDELQAALLNVKLRYLDEENARRRAIARYYDKHLRDTGLMLPVTRPEAEPVYHQYVVRSPRRDAVRAQLKERGIGTLIHYPTPIHQQPAYAGRALLGPGGLPHTEQASHEIFSLPMFPELTEAELESVVKEVRAVVG